MYEKFLSASKGLHMTQAQALSNICNQHCDDIELKLKYLNNYSGCVQINGKDYTHTIARPIPSDINDLLKTKGELHACQAFMVECIKAKTNLLSSVQKSRYDESSIEVPQQPKYETVNTKSEVNEVWAKTQLSDVEASEFIYHETMAIHYGKFIHKDSPLDVLRKELPSIKSLDWIEVETGVKTPIQIVAHHTQDGLLDIHTKIAELHRFHEQKTNYYKAKLKNLITTENSRIAIENAKLISEIEKRNDILRKDYQIKYQAYLTERHIATQNFESEKQLKIKEISAYRINCPVIFQPMIDRFQSIIKSNDPKNHSDEEVK